MKASLQEITSCADSIFVMHEKCERDIPFHQHSKHQFTYVESGLAYLVLKEQQLTVTLRHYFWIPAGVKHTLRIGHPGTRCRTLFFNTCDDTQDPFYHHTGIYPVTSVLLHMIQHTTAWSGHVLPGDERFTFLQNMKTLLPLLHVALAAP